MKIFCFKPNVSYSGGCIIVAANSPQEALSTIMTDESCFLACYANINNCSELTELSTNLKEPKVIIDTFYIE